MSRIIQQLVFLTAIVASVIVSFACYGPVVGFLCIIVVLLILK